MWGGRGWCCGATARGLQSSKRNRRGSWWLCPLCARFSLGSGTAYGGSQALSSNSAPRCIWDRWWEEEEGRTAPSPERRCYLGAYIKFFFPRYFQM